MQSGAMLPNYSQAYIKRVISRVTLVLIILKHLTFRHLRSTSYSSGRVPVFRCISLAATVRVFRLKAALHIKYTVRIGGYTFLFGRHELSFLLQILTSRARFF